MASDKARIIQLNALLAQSETYINRLEQTLASAGIPVPERIVTEPTTSAPQPAGPGTGVIPATFADNTDMPTPRPTQQAPVEEAPEPESSESQMAGLVARMSSMLTSLSNRIDVIEGAVNDILSAPEKTEPATPAKKKPAKKRKPPVKACPVCNQDVLSMHHKKHVEGCSADKPSSRGVYNG